MKNLYLVQWIAGDYVLRCTTEEWTLKYKKNSVWTITKVVLRMWEVIENSVISVQNKTKSVQA
ncbi:hypothetical protein [Bacillus sp. NPDC094106]|uniref:hypothetical protein n=1 Tax=Bacillus sp. NPDC094106 TaxID=3363949 RepID=UPI0038218658